MPTRNQILLIESGEPESSLALPLISSLPCFKRQHSHRPGIITLLTSDYDLDETSQELVIKHSFWRRCRDMQAKDPVSVVFVLPTFDFQKKRVTRSIFRCFLMMNILVGRDSSLLHSMQILIMRDTISNCSDDIPDLDIKTTVQDMINRRLIHRSYSHMKSQMLVWSGSRSIIEGRLLRHKIFACRYSKMEFGRILTRPEETKTLQRFFIMSVAMFIYLSALYEWPVLRPFLLSGILIPLNAQRLSRFSRDLCLRIRGFGVQGQVGAHSLMARVASVSDSVVNVNQSLSSLLLAHGRLATQATLTLEELQPKIDRFADHVVKYTDRLGEQSEITLRALGDQTLATQSKLSDLLDEARRSLGAVTEDVSMLTNTANRTVSDTNKSLGDAIVSYRHQLAHEVSCLREGLSDALKAGAIAPRVNISDNVVVASASARAKICLIM